MKTVPGAAARSEGANGSDSDPQSDDESDSNDEDDNDESEDSDDASPPGGSRAQARTTMPKYKPRPLMQEGRLVHNVNLLNEQLEALFQQTHGGPPCVGAISKLAAGAVYRASRSLLALNRLSVHAPAPPHS